MKVRVKATGEIGVDVVPEVNGKRLIQLDGSCLLRVLDSDQLEQVPDPEAPEGTEQMTPPEEP